MNKRSLLLCLGALASYSACTLFQAKPQNPAYGPGTSTAAPSPTTGVLTSMNTAPPTPAGAVPPVALITAAKNVTQDDTFLVSGLGSSVGSGVGLTYQWSISVGASIIDDCGKPMQMNQPAIELCSKQSTGDFTITLTVNNGTASATTTHSGKVVLTSTMTTLGNNGTTGGTITIDAANAIDNRETELPGIPPQMTGTGVILEIAKSFNNDFQINDDDVCRLAQKFASNDTTRVCIPANSPPSIKAIHIRDPLVNSIGLGVKLNLNNFINPETGLKIEEVRFVTKVTKTDQPVEIENADRVVIEDNIVASRIIIGSHAIGGCTTVPSNFPTAVMGDVAQVYAASVQGGLIFTTANGGAVCVKTTTIPADVVAPILRPVAIPGGDLQILGGVDTSTSTAAQAGGVIKINSAARAVLSGEYKANGEGGGNITINAATRVELRRFRQMSVSGGTASAAFIGADAGKIDIGQTTAPTNIFLENMVFTAKGGQAGLGADAGAGNRAGGDGGTVKLKAVEGIIVGASQKITKTIIDTTGGASLSDAGSGGGKAGNGAAVELETTANTGTQTAGIFGIGGVIRTDGGHNKVAAVPGGPQRATGGNAGAIDLKTDAAAGENSIFWVGDMSARGGDSKIAGTSGAIITAAPGAPSTIKITADADRDSSIFVKGNLFARFGRGIAGAATCSVSGNITLSAKSSGALGAATAGTSSIKIEGAVDTQGSFLTGDANEAPTSIPPNDTAVANPGALQGTPAGGSVSVDFGGSRSSDLSISEVNLKGGAGEAGAEGCSFTATFIQTADTVADPEGPVVVQLPSVNLSGGASTEAAAAPKSGDFKLLIDYANKAHPSRFDVRMPGGINAFGGEQVLCGPSIGEAGNTTAGNGGDVEFDLREAQEVLGDIGVVNMYGGDSGAKEVATKARTAGTGGTFKAQLGDGESTRIGWKNANVNAQGGSGKLCSGGLASVRGGGTGITSAVATANNLPTGNDNDVALDPTTATTEKFTLNVGGKRYFNVDVQFADVNTNAGASVAGGAADATEGAGNSGGSAVLRLLGQGSYTFANFNLNGSNATAGSGTNRQDGAPGGSFFVTTKAGRPVTFKVTGTVKTQAGAGVNANADGGAGGRVLFRIPTPIDATVASFNTSSGLQGTGGTARIAGSIHHRVGSTEITINKVKCTTVASLGVTGSMPPCVDDVFECAPAGNICLYP
ncbi:MAG: hypothetical protein IT381_17720 [Deltaproteobacteria bacterium]|nr:hypothetical protein [Deltaproteobacteria bacterium]